MSVHSLPPASEEPEATLISWRVFEVKSENWPDTTRHLVGYDPIHGEGRVSSSATYLGMTKKGVAFKTRSGRSYELQRDPGYNMDAQYVWTFWKDRCKVTEEKDVTHEYTPGAVVEESVKPDSEEGRVA